jgi:hypothetical protein
MKLLASAIALTFALGAMAAPAANAEQPGAFRSAAPQTFTTEDLQRYGLSRDDATQIADMQAQGYEVQVISEEEAAQYRAGQYADNHMMWLVIGGVILIVLVAAAVN